MTTSGILLTVFNNVKVMLHVFYIENRRVDTVRRVQHKHKRDPREVGP